MSTEEEQYDAALDLLRRTDPARVAANLVAICRTNQDIAEDLLSTVDQPLVVKTDTSVGKKFLCCDYNRDGDSHRSPHSNTYFPPVEDPIAIGADVRKLEVLANTAFDTYRELYYGGGLSSVYLWDGEGGAEFSGVVLLQKERAQSRWDSIHVAEVLRQGDAFAYRLTSTVMLEVGHAETRLSGHLTRQAEKVLAAAAPEDHVLNLGAFVEEVENRLRTLLHEVYFGKTRDIVGDIRSVADLKDVQADEKRKREIAKSLA